MNEIKDILIGSCCVAVGQLFFGAIEVLVKISNLKIGQILSGRYCFQLIISFLSWFICISFNQFPPHIKNCYGDKPYIMNIWIRGICQSICMTSAYYAVIKLPVGDFQCFFYTAPLMIVFVARIWLKEKLPNLFILIPTTLLTCCGIILVSQPRFLLNIMNINNDEYEPLDMYGIITVIIAALSWTFSAILVRKAIKTHFIQLEIANGLISLCLIIPMIFVINEFVIKTDEIGTINEDDWRFDTESIVMMMNISFCGFSAICFSVIGYQYGTATTVSWLEYMNIPIGFIYQILIFEEMPNKYEIIGAMMVTVACVLPSIHQLYLYFHQKPEVTDNNQDHYL